MAPAIRLASDGFAVASKSALRMARTADLLDITEECRRILKKPDGSLYRAGDRMTMVDYGRSLSAVSEHGPAAIHPGALGAGIVPEMPDTDGLLTAADRAGYPVAERWTSS